MRYRILPTIEFSRDFKKLDNTIQKAMRKKIEEVAEDPTHYKHLHYDLAGSARIRAGKLRVIFSYDVSKNELYLEKIIPDHNYKKK